MTTPDRLGGVERITTTPSHGILSSLKILSYRILGIGCQKNFTPGSPPHLHKGYPGQHSWQLHSARKPGSEILLIEGPLASRRGTVAGGVGVEVFSATAYELLTSSFGRNNRLLWLYKPRHFRRGSWLDLNFTGYSVPLGVEACSNAWRTIGEVIYGGPYICMSEKRRTFKSIG